MKRRIVCGLLLGLAGFLMGQSPVLADAPPPPQVKFQLSPQRLDVLDRRGYFTPAFKTAVHDLVKTKQDVVDAKAELKRLQAELPALEKQVDDAEVKVADLQKQYDALNHIDESDFAALQKAISDPNAKLEDQQILAQAYVWGYPASPHQAEAQKYLADTQKKIADKAQAAADAEAARIAAHEKLVQRAQAKDLSVNEWRDFLLTMSKADIVKFMGPPQAGNSDEWSYTGIWSEDPITHEKVGLEVNFNAGRVINVTALTH